MTVKLRQRLYYGFFVLAILAFVAGIFFVIDAGLERFTTIRETLYPQLSMTVFMSGIFSAFLCMFFSVILLGFIAFRTGRNVSAEIFFFSIWCLGLSFELGRVVVLWLSMHGVGIASLALVTRVVMFGRYLGTLAIFMGSLFALGFKQDRIVTMFMLTVFGSLFFSSIQPLNTGQLGPGFLVMRGYASLVYFFDLMLILSVFVNYLIAARITKERAFLSACFTMTGASLALLVLRLTPGLLLGPIALAVLVVASAYYLKTLYAYYLWR